MAGSLFTAALTAATLLASTVSSHMVATYPGTRGNNLHANGTVNTDDYSNTTWPYGMQWAYPCGGLKMTSNRTYWPTTGGAVAWQMGWFPGHGKALHYINLGINQPDGSAPLNYSHVMQPQFAIEGPTNGAYPGLSICLPQVPTPAGLTFYEGQNATIQIVEAAQHGAALFACIDITFTNDMSKVQLVNETNCRNDSGVRFDNVYYSPVQTNAASSLRTFGSASMGLIGTLAVAAVTMVVL